MGTDADFEPDGEATDDNVTHPMGTGPTLADRIPVMARRQSIREIIYYFSSKPVTTIPTVTSLNIDDWPAGQISVMWVHIVSDAFGSPVCVPVMLAKGPAPGKVVGLTAAIHGNEVSGIPTIQKIFHDLAPHICNLKGAVVAVPCCNQFGFENATRFYQDGSDLNRCFASAFKAEKGVGTATRSHQYCKNLFERVLANCNVLIDLHTASFGRHNSFYVRADMRLPSVARLARLVQPQIIVHNVGTGGDGGGGTLRGAATARGIDSVTIEIGDSTSFNRTLIGMTYAGIARVLDDIGVVEVPEFRALDETRPPTVICSHSYWMQTDVGGVLDVVPRCAELVVRGQFLASVVDIFGFVIRKYVAPEDGVVIGKSTNPANVQGDRILHLGVVAPPAMFNDDGTIQRDVVITSQHGVICGD
ncbi:Peptidase M14 carboxypeptidase A domain-containing protein [Plasmodiophora brassicae]